MISSRKLKQMEKMWLKAAVAGRKRITFGRTVGVASSDGSTAAPADRGHFIVYTNDGKRFMIPLAWLGSDAFRQLLSMAEDEFGLPSNWPITLPCDAALMDDIVALLRTRRAKGLEEALLSSMASRQWLASSSSSSSSLIGVQSSCQLLTCST